MADPQTPRFGELLHRLLITKGYGQANVLDDYFPVIDLLADKPEVMKLRDERTFAGGGTGLGGVGTGGRLWCMNKLTTQLAVVDGLLLGAPTQANFFIDLTTIGLPADGAGGQTTGHSCDSRYGTGLPGTTPPAPVTFANDQTAAPGGVRYLVTTATTVFVPIRYVLKPGYALAVGTDLQGAGNNIAVTFFGYGRPIDDSELK